MRRFSLPATAAILATLAFGAASAQTQPVVIPYIGQAPHDESETYRTLMNYFSDSSMSLFQIVSADKKTGTIVARRSGIDSATWTRWAYCKVSTTQLIYSLGDATATVKVRVERITRHSTEVRVTADFEGTYNLGSNQMTKQCNSNGELERNILAAAGVPAGGN